LQNGFSSLEQTGEPLPTADHQWWRRSFHFFYGEAQAGLSFVARLWLVVLTMWPFK
jgi:hypothetical protein